MKHTPGPWKQSGRTIYSPYKGIAVAIMANRATNTADVKPLGITDKGWDVAMHDAALIAAAPELLASLMLAIRFLDHPEVKAIPFAMPVDGVITQARAALAKATGEKDTAPSANGAAKGK